ncbi:hypothetical protein J6590_005544 [Homalodisca vitripennis]|nr:hypothetical protein J6590_005544 [Homalodisca vitripennis]
MMYACKFGDKRDLVIDIVKIIPSGRFTIPELRTTKDNTSTNTTLVSMATRSIPLEVPRRNWPLRSTTCSPVPLHHDQPQKVALENRYQLTDVDLDSWLASSKGGGGDFQLLQGLQGCSGIQKRAGPLFTLRIVTGIDRGRNKVRKEPSQEQRGKRLQSDQVTSDGSYDTHSNEN